MYRDKMRKEKWSKILKFRQQISERRECTLTKDTKGNKI
jgi:hypothetical protein